MKLALAVGIVIAGLLMANVSSMSARAPASLRQRATEYWVYVGSAAYNEVGPTKSLYVCRFNSKTGELKAVGVAVETINPGFLAVHPSDKFIYAVNEIGEFQGQKNGAISSFRIDHRTGKLAFLNQVPALGANPAFVTVSKNGKFVLVASYYGGVVSRHIRADGAIGDPAAAAQMGVPANAPHQENSHPHAVLLSSDQRFAIILDLGLDRVFAYRFDENSGGLTENAPSFWQSKAGLGPRHIALTPDQRFAYVMNEIGSSLSALSYDVRGGTFQHLETVSALPPDINEPNTGAEVVVSASGKFVYSSNRGHNSIAVFAIDAEKGTLTSVQDVPTLGKTPRNFAIDPSGNFLLVGNQDSNEIVEFRIDSSTGRLAPTGVKVQIGSPVCIVFVPGQ